MPGLSPGVFLGVKPVVLILSIITYAHICSGQVSLTGVIYSVSDKQPVFGANIFIKELNKGTASDKNGKFRFEDIKKGNYTLIVSYIGFKKLEKTIRIRESHKNFLKIEIQPESYKLAEIDIVADKEKNIDLKSSQKVHLIKAKQIERIPASNLDQVFEFISGVNVERDFGIYSDKASVTIRGVGNDQGRTLVVLDGVPLNKSDGGSVNWNLIGKDNIGGIKIIKGPGSAKYGSNAMGGVIEISSKLPANKIEGNISAKYGTYNTKSYNINLGGKLNLKEKNYLYWRINHHMINSDGYINIPDELITAADTDIVASYLKEYKVGTVIGYQTDQTKIEISGNYFDDKRGKGFKVYELDGGFSEHDTYNTFIRLEHQFSALKMLFYAFNIHEEYGRMNEFMQDGEYKLYEVISNRDDRGGKLLLEKVKGNHKILLGGEFKNGNVAGQDIYYTSTDLIRNAGSMNIYSGFVQDEFNLFTENLFFNIGVRADFANFYNGLFTIEYPSYSIEYLVDYQKDDIPSDDWSALSPKFSVQYKFNEKNRFYFSSGKGFRAPDLDDMCRSSKSTFGFTALNPELSPEYLANYELGGDFTIKKKITLSGTVFYANGMDYIYTVSTSDSVNMGYTIAPVFKKQNISSVDICGFETDIHLNVNKYISAFANYTYTHSQVKDYIKKSAADFDLTNKFLSNIPFHKSSAGLNFNNEFSGVSILWKYIGKRYINDQNRVDEVYFISDMFEAYQIFDLKVYVKFKKHYLASLGIENFFNTIYNNSKGYLNQGRFIMLELIFNFEHKQLNR